MANLGTLSVLLNADTSPFSRALSRAQRSVFSFKTAAVAGLTVAAAAITKFGVESVKSFAVQEKAEAKRAAVLRATGFAAGLTSKELQKSAEAMSVAMNIPDEDIVDLQAKMLTFKNISGDIFDRAATAAIDMGAAMGTGATSGVIQLGKALNDPINGITALTRVGVTFTEQQKEQIKTMQESGNLLGAQQIILGELESEFGGVAEAMADTEPWKAVTIAFGDLMEGIGEVISILFDLGDTSKSIGARIGEWATRLKESAIGTAVFFKSLWVEIKFGGKQAAAIFQNVAENIITGALRMWQVIKKLGSVVADFFKNPVEFFKKDKHKLAFDINFTGLEYKDVFGDVEEIEKEKNKELAQIFKDGMEKQNKRQEKDIKEMKAARAAREAKTMTPKEEAKEAVKAARRQFAGAFEVGSTQAHSALLAAGRMNDQQKIVENTGMIAKGIDRLIKTMKDGPKVATI